MVMTTQLCKVKSLKVFNLANKLANHQEKYYLNSSQLVWSNMIELHDIWKKNIHIEFIRIRFDDVGE